MFHVIVYDPRGQEIWILQPLYYLRQGFPEKYFFFLYFHSTSTLLLWSTLSYIYLFTIHFYLLFFNTYAYNSNDYFHIYMQMLNSSTLSLKYMDKIYIRWAIQYSDILPSFGCRGVQRFWPGRGGFPEEKKWGEPNYDGIMSLKMIS